MTTPTTTPTPWDVRLDNDGSWWVIERDTQRGVAYIGHESDARAQGDAAFAVLTANAHAPLVEALEGARHALTTLHNLTATDLPHEYEDAMSDGCDGHGARDSQLEVSWVIDETRALAEIDAALVLARGETP